MNNKEEIIARNMIAIAKRKKKKGNSRSKMLKVIMPHLSQETGKALADAIEKKNVGLFKRTWDKVKSEIAEVIQPHKSHSGSEEVCEGQHKYFTKDEVREAARAKYTPEQLEKAQKVLSRDGFLDEMMACIVEDLELDESTSSNYHDFSRILTNKGFNGENIIKFVANGAVDLRATIQGQEYNYVLKLFSISTLNNRINNDFDNVELKIEAYLYNADEDKPIQKFKELGSMAAASTEIVIKASSFLSKLK